MPNKDFESFKDSLGIGFVGEVREDGKYHIDLKDSNDYQILFNLLDDNESLELDEENVVYDYDRNEVDFFTDLYHINLSANFDEDKYSLYIEGRK